jgi:hypothetical protein
MRCVLANLLTAFMELQFVWFMTRFFRKCDFTTLEDFEKYAETLLVVSACGAFHSLAILFIFISRIS